MASPSAPAGAATIGEAVGLIRLNYREFERGRDVVISSSRQMTQAMTGFGQEARAAMSYAQLGMTAITVAGVAAVQRVKQLEGLFVALSGSQEKAIDNMNRLREMAERTGQPFLTLAESATSILPAISRTNASLEQTLSIAQRLGTLDRQQGAVGAGLAIREFLSGETISLAKRFELDKNRLKSIMAEANGDMQKAIEGLDEYVNELGLTQQWLEEMGQSGAYAFDVLRGEITETLSTAFEPLVNEGILPAVRGLRELLVAVQETNPDLLQMGANLIAILGTARALGAIGLTGSARVLGGVGVGGFLGAELGIAASRGLSQAGIGDPQLATMDQDQARDLLGERLKQSIALVLTGIDGFVTVLEIAKASLEQAFEHIGLAIETAVLQLELFARRHLGLGDSRQGVHP